MSSDGSASSSREIHTEFRTEIRTEFLRLGVTQDSAGE